MDNTSGIGKIAEAFSELLCIRRIEKMQILKFNEFQTGAVWGETKSVPDDVKRLFAEKTIEVLFQEASEDHPISFAFDCEDRFITDELLRVFQYLPEIESNEIYSFPPETILQVIVEQCDFQNGKPLYDIKCLLSENISLLL